MYVSLHEAGKSAKHRPYHYLPFAVIQTSKVLRLKPIHVRYVSKAHLQDCLSFPKSTFKGIKSTYKRQDANYFNELSICIANKEIDTR